jgi:triosephosphate isomerase
MTATRPRPLVAGNWKMNGRMASLRAVNELREGYGRDLKARADLLVCPPATLVHLFAHAALGSGIAVGGQDCHQDESGAHTGDVAAEMLADVGASFVIVGHSERRQDHGETDRVVQAKAGAALRAGLTPIVCVGESRAERDAGKALAIVRRQLRGSFPDSAIAGAVVIAYEPVWAIGTGLTPTVDDIAEVHGLIREELRRLVGKSAHEGVRILYGGSVKPSNARELLAVANVDGALVGGASLVPGDFLAIARSYLPVES